MRSGAGFFSWGDVSVQIKVDFGFQVLKLGILNNFDEKKSAAKKR